MLSQKAFEIIHLQISDEYSEDRAATIKDLISKMYWTNNLDLSYQYTELKGYGHLDNLMN